jgi:hypothetical protein
LVVVGATRHGPFTAVATAIGFSADGSKATFGARVGEELWWKVIPLR